MGRRPARSHQRFGHSRTNVLRARIAYLRLDRPSRSTRSLAQEGLNVAVNDMGIVQAIHLTIFHRLLDNLCERIFGRAPETAPQLVSKPA